MEFEAENEYGIKEVAVAPSSWLRENGSKCAWPGYRGLQTITKAVQNRIPAKEEWKVYDLSRIMFSTGMHTTVNPFKLARIYVCIFDITTCSQELKFTVQL